MKKTAVLYVVIQLTIISFSFAQTKVCYIWVKDHWERPRANVKYHPDSLHCFEGLPPAGPQGGVTVTDRVKNGETITTGTVTMGNVRDHRNETVMVEKETATEKNFTLTALNNMLPADLQLWNKAVNDQLGIIGTDYGGYEDIGSAAFERAAEAWYITDHFNIWYPQHQTATQPTNLKYYKRTLIGTIDTDKKPEVQNINKQYNDFDINIHIKPYPNYMYLINEGHKPAVTRKQVLSEYDKEGAHCPNKFFTTVEAEVQIGKDDAEKMFMPLINQRLNKSIGVYGPWVWDEGHCHQPEIHPSEQVWWSDNIGTNKIYTCNVFCDASKRFWWRSQMDDGTKIKPWGAPPIKAVFAIAFEVTLGNTLSVNSGVQKVFEVSNISHFNVRDYLKTDNINGDKMYHLNYQGKPVVSFIPHNNSFKVSFEKIGLIPASMPGAENKLRGFLVIETEVGTCTLKNKKVTILNPVYTVGGSQPQFITVTVADNADVNKVSEEIEKKAFEKIDGHYIFKVTETVKRNNLSTGTSGKMN